MMLKQKSASESRIRKIIFKVQGHRKETNYNMKQSEKEESKQGKANKVGRKTKSLAPQKRKRRWSFILGDSTIFQALNKEQKLNQNKVSFFLYHFSLFLTVCLFYECRFVASQMGFPRKCTYCVSVSK